MAKIITMVINNYLYLFHVNVLRMFLVSLVDGYDLPVSITNNVGCAVASCPVDLGPDCQYSEFNQQ